MTTNTAPSDHARLPDAASAKSGPMGKRISAARREAGFATARDFSARLGVSVWTVRAWEAGKSRPRYEMLPTIAELTGYPVAHFLGADPIPASLPHSDDDEAGVYGIAPINRDAEQALVALSDDAREWKLLLRLNAPAVATADQIAALHAAVRALQNPDSAS